jgi:hypothetical protein
MEMGTGTRGRIAGFAGSRARHDRSDGGDAIGQPLRAEREKPPFDMLVA